jgi:hypothetical protein
MILDILKIPFEFIKEHLTGWVIIILIILIIYFVCLRSYYIQKERFYNQSINEQNANTDGNDDGNGDGNGDGFF